MNYRKLVAAKLGLSFRHYIMRAFKFGADSAIAMEKFAKIEGFLEGIAFVDTITVAEKEALLKEIQAIRTKYWELIDVEATPDFIDKMTAQARGQIQKILAKEESR